MKLFLPAILTILKVILTIPLLPELLAIKLWEIKDTIIKKKYLKSVQLQQESQQLFYNFSNTCKQNHWCLYILKQDANRLPFQN